MAAVIDWSLAEKLAPIPPLSLKPLNGFVFLEGSPDQRKFTLVNRVSGERAVLPTLNADEKWRLVVQQIMEGKYSIHFGVEGAQSSTGEDFDTKESSANNMW